MNPTATMPDTFPKRFNTKVVGTTFEGRQQLLAECRRQDIRDLELVPDPTNRYDSHAVAVEARMVSDSGRAVTVRLGFLSNSDRVCSDCGKLVGAALFEKSRQLRCPECDFEFGYDDPVVTRGPSGISQMLCPRCGEDVELGLAKVVSCPGCGGTDFGRGGLATRLSRALAAGIHYRAWVEDYTGGDSTSDGRQRSLGCNIRIERIEK